eukprot:PhM_4_TR4538/c0_g3_i1/m.61924
MSSSISSVALILCPMLFYFFFFLAIVTSPSAVSALPTGEWTLLPAQPPPRSKHGQVKLTNDTLFIFGGRSPGGESMNDAWTYNLTSKIFTQVQLHGEKPPIRAAASVVGIHNSRSPSGLPLIYIFGGLLNENPTTNYDMFVINPVNWLSVKLNPSSSVIGRFRQSTVVQGTKFITLFGVARGTSNEVWEFDSEATSWRELVPVNTAPLPRQDPCCDTFNATAIICVGGTTIDLTEPMDVLIFDTVSRIWETVPTVTAAANLPGGRRLHACYYRQDVKKYTLSLGWSGVALEGYADMWDFDIASRTWIKITLNVATQLIDSALYTVMPDNNAYMFGGWGEETTLNHLWAHNIITHTNTKVIDAEEKPMSRFLHCAVSIGDMIYVGLGANALTILTDWWKFNTTDEKWTRVAITGTPLAVAGPSCIDHGSLILIFGGRTSMTASTFSDELYTLNQRSEISLVKLASTTKPAPRFSAAIVVFGDNIVLYGGKGMRDEPYEDMWIFNPNIFEWIETSRNKGSDGIALPGYRFKHGLVVIQNTRLMVLNGDDGSQNYQTKWLSTPVFRGIRDVLAEFSELPRHDISPLTDADTVRTSSVYAVGHNATNVLIVGGSMDGDTVVRSSRMHSFSSLTGNQYMFPPMPVYVSEASLNYVGKSIYVFGGRLLDKGVIFDAVSSMQKFAFTSPMCTSWDDSGGCQTCPRGFVPPNCSPCPVNTYFDVDLSRCLSCPGGRVNDLPGLSSRFACTVREEPVTGSKPMSVTFSDQPRAYTPGSTPFYIWIIVIIIASMSVIVLFLMIFGVDAMARSRRSKWITAEMFEVLEREFMKVSGGDNPEAGLVDYQLFMLFQTLSTPESRYCVTEEWILHLVMKYDGDGSRQIEIDEFLDMIIETCMSIKSEFNVDWKRLGVSEADVPPAMKPLPPPGDPERDELVSVKKYASGRVNFTLKSIDFFYDGHTVGALGEAMYFKATDTGGITTLFWIFGMVVIVLALSGEMIFANTMEERASQPYVSLPFYITSSVEVTLTLYGSGFRGLSTGPAIDEACNSFDVTIASTITPHGEITKKCSVGTTTDEFNVTYSCESCNLGFSQSQIDMSSTDDRAYATAVGVNVRSFSGIENDDHGDQYSATRRIVYAEPGGVLRGLGNPAQFTCETFPTVYGWKTDIDDRNVNKTRTGYHVYMTAATAESVPISNFLTVNGLRAGLLFQLRGSSTLMVSRRKKQTELAFFSGLVGALSGFVGFCILLMKTWDGQILRARLKQKEEEKKKRRRNSASISVISGTKQLPLPKEFDLKLAESVTDLPGVPGWFAQAEKLMGTGISFSQAKSIIEVVMAMNENGGAGGAGGRARTPELDPLDDGDQIVTAGAPYGTKV